jgi:hypothetical protein
MALRNRGRWGSNDWSRPVIPVLASRPAWRFRPPAARRLHRQCHRASPLLRGMRLPGCHELRLSQRSQLPRNSGWSSFGDDGRGRAAVAAPRRGQALGPARFSPPRGHGGLRGQRRCPQGRRARAMRLAAQQRQRRCSRSLAQQAHRGVRVRRHVTSTGVRGDSSGAGEAAVARTGGPPGEFSSGLPVSLPVLQ